MKAKHLILIGLHLLFWVLNYLYVTKGNLAWNGFGNTNGTLPLAYTYGIFFNAFLCYIQVFWLVPKFYIKNKKGIFWLLSVAILIGITVVETYLDLTVAEKYEVYKDGEFPHFVYAFAWFYHNIIFHTLYSVFGFFYRFLFEYRKAQKASQELLKETHHTELKYLKAQLNPHFLFNGINSVYHLIGKNNSLAKDTLLQFSGLLRYQLYESSEAFIRLEKELEYVTQYIQLEEIRKGEDIILNFEIDFENASQRIAPLLLTPFIENAFKHISHNNRSSDNKISISINETNNELFLTVVNTYDSTSKKHDFGGVGLTNVQRRLALLYPNKHQLSIDQKEGHFIANLKIDLS